MIKAKFLGNKIPKKNVHYACIVYATIDSFIKMEKKNYPQVCLMQIQNKKDKDV